MPEGPSIVILKQQVQPFIGKTVIKVEGNSKQDIQRLHGEKIIDFKSWGKHFLICFPTFTVRIHFMLFGSYRINEQKDAASRLRLVFKKGELNFYTCSVRFIEEDLDEIYNWTADVMNDAWNGRAAAKKLKTKPDTLITDALLDQNIFAGVGNIIKNEVLFRTRLHPENIIRNIPTRKLNEVIREARTYSFEFLEWKKQFVLRKHWLAYAKKTCPRDDVPFIKKHVGKTNRRTFYCNVCQLLYPKENESNLNKKTS